MGITGIIAEFNPLHNGHKLLIDSAKQNGNRVVCVISGNFVQRGDTAIISKQKRTEAALLCGADVVIEMPVLWSMSTAQNFALAGVWELYNLGCDEILFGSETADIDALNRAADVLLSDEFFSLVSSEVKSGITYACARQSAAEKLGIENGLLENANDNLGIEYIIAAKKLNLPLKFRCIKRTGAAHGSNTSSGIYASSSYIRERILSGDIGYAERFMPACLHGMIQKDNISDIKRIERAVLSVLRTKTAQDFKSLPDLSEGLENKILFSLNTATTLDGLYGMIKSKRYTHSRIRRLVLSAFLGFDSSLFMTAPPYVRVLGFGKDGEKLLKNCVSLIPVITRVSAIKELDTVSKKVFDTECRATDLYAMSFEVPLPCGIEYKRKLLKTECL